MLFSGMGEIKHQCKYCNSSSAGNFCSTCGNPFNTKRLSLGSIVHEAFHFFTHLDHGFPYTLKKLFTTPGTMQRKYIEGERHKYQKPFSMFFICGTIAALAIYWINLLLISHFNAGDSKEAMFFHKYWVILQVFMLPVYAFVTYIFFRRSGLFYGEIMVFQLYLFSFLFIVLSVIHLFKFLAPHLQTRYIELPVIVVYSIITNLNFFTGLKRPVVVIYTILSIGISFLLASVVQDFLVKAFS
jgi:hypothetical protein